MSGGIDVEAIRVAAAEAQPCEGGGRGVVVSAEWLLKVAADLETGARLINHLRLQVFAMQIGLKS